MDCSPPGSSDHGIFQARILKWLAISFSRGSSWPRDQTCTSCLAGFTTEPPREPFVWMDWLRLLDLPLLEFAQVHVHCIGDAIELSHPLMPSFPSALDLFSIRDFFNESAVCIWWLRYWSFSFNLSPSSEYSGLIFLKIYWFDLAVQGTFKSLLQHLSRRY